MATHKEVTDEIDKGMRLADILTRIESNNNVNEVLSKENYKRRNNPYLVKNLGINIFLVLFIFLSMVGCGILAYLTRESIYYWGVGLFGIPFLLYSVVSELEGRRITESERKLLIFVRIFFGSLKWICIIGIMTLVFAVLGGLVSSLSATTIIIILLVLIYFKK